MPYQYKREPLIPDEANRVANACQTHEEKLGVWTLLDAGLRVAELAKLTKANIDWRATGSWSTARAAPTGVSQSAGSFA